MVLHYSVEFNTFTNWCIKIQEIWPHLTSTWRHFTLRNVTIYKKVLPEWELWVKFHLLSWIEIHSQYKKKTKIVYYLQCNYTNSTNGVQFKNLHSHQAKCTWINHENNKWNNIIPHQQKLRNLNHLSESNKTTSWLNHQQQPNKTKNGY